jgi:hypothetical protein
MVATSASALAARRSGSAGSPGFGAEQVQRPDGLVAAPASPPRAPTGSPDPGPAALIRGHRSVCAAIRGIVCAAPVR